MHGGLGVGGLAPLAAVWREKGTGGGVETASQEATVGIQARDDGGAEMSGAEEGTEFPKLGVSFAPGLAYALKGRQGRTHTDGVGRMAKCPVWHSSEWQRTVVESFGGQWWPVWGLSSL